MHFNKTDYKSNFNLLESYYILSIFLKPGYLIILIISYLLGKIF